MSNYDFSALQVTDEPRPMAVKHPVDGRQIATIWLVSIDADRPRTVLRRQQKARLRSISRGRTPDPDEVEQDTLDLLAACTIRWEGVEWQGAPLECSKENARMLYEKVLWLRSDVDRFINDTSGFLEASAKSSSGTSAITFG